MFVSALSVYPVKSGAGLSVKSWPLGADGLDHDREFMVVDAQGRFLTQREEPRLALVKPLIGPPLSIRTPVGAAVTAIGQPCTVQVWEYSGPALDCGDDAAALLSEFLGRPVRLVTVTPGHDRPTELGNAQVGFSDGFPLLITTQASLDELNARLPVALPMQRFRPNIVIDGCEAFAEDTWSRIRIGTVDIDVVKPCLRCAITRVDHRTGVRGDGEPLRTLGAFRKMKGGVAFGQNAIHRGLGTLRVGDPVSVTALRP
ncbi:MAG: MOSC domain-containing protein [Candidatus Nanopelagicales bacterium]|jgi:uncharacterized protein YcbX|nr:MOSC domain-containing protein [Candidatus Nanopelagicales bacterium]